MRKFISIGMLFGIFFFLFPETAFAGCSKCKERGLQLLKKEREEKGEITDYDQNSTEWNKKGDNSTDTKPKKQKKSKKKNGDS